MAEPRAIKNHRQTICIQVVPSPLGIVFKKRYGLKLNTDNFEIKILLPHRSRSMTLVLGLLVQEMQ